MKRSLFDRLLASGAKFYDWMPDSLGDGISEDEIFARFVSVISRLSKSSNSDGNL